MSAQSCTLKKNATGITVTGGTDETFTEIGSSVSNGLVAADAAVTDFATQPSVVYQNRQPAKQGNGSWSKAKRSATITVPKLMASGKIELDRLRIEFETTIETTAAEKLNLKLLGSQALASASLLNFWDAGSLRS